MLQFTKLGRQIPDEFRELFGSKRLGSGAEVTALDYKPWNDSMPHRVVVKPKLGELEKITNMLGRSLRKEFKLNPAEARYQNHMAISHLLLGSFSKRDRLG